MRLNPGGVTIVGPSVKINSGGSPGVGSGAEPEQPELSIGVGPEGKPIYQQQIKSLPKKASKNGIGPIDCGFLDKQYTVEADQKLFDKNRIRQQLPDPEKIKYRFKGQPNEQDAYRYIAKTNGKDVAIIRPLAHISTNGKYLATVTQVTRALGTLTEKQANSIGTVIINPTPNPDDAYWAMEYNNPEVGRQIRTPC